MIPSSNHGQSQEPESAENSEPWEPQVVLSHLVYFFVPLRDPLDVPPKFIFKCFESVPHKSMNQEGLPPWHIGASLCFHRINSDFIANETQSLFDLASKSMPHPIGPEPSEVPGVNGDAGAVGDSSQGHRHTTIVELAVALDISDESISSFGSVHSEDSSGEDEISEAFDRGLDYIRSFQRAYYTTKQVPIRLVTRESIPPIIPFAVRSLWDEDGEPSPFVAPIGLYLVNMNIEGTVSDWSEQDAQMLKRAVFLESENAAFETFRDLMREANVALYRDGAYRSAVLFAATASETLFDGLISHLLWEEGESPGCGTEFFDSMESISKRVRNLYHVRLGGKWSLDSPGPINSWAKDVAALRNRAVHGGYEPSKLEAEVALDSVEELVKFLGDRVASRISRYPRTAMAILGKEGIERRGKWSKLIEKLVEDTREVNWVQTFGRWRFAMDAKRSGSQVDAIPASSESSILFVSRVSGIGQWVVHDASARMAATVDGSLILGVQSEQFKSLESANTLNHNSKERVNSSTFVYGAYVESVPDGSWVPDYWLVPEAGVMVDGEDFEKFASSSM